MTMANKTSASEPRVVWVELVIAAARLAVPYHTAHRWALTGRLTAVRRDGRWWVDRATVTKLARELACEQPVTKPAGS